MPEGSTASTRQAVCCGCHQQCGLVVRVSGNSVERISGDRQHPLSAGFACIKGVRAKDLHAHPDRVHRPLKRVGPRGGGRWQEIPWSQAMDEIAESMRRLAERHGPETVAYGFGTFHGADWGIGQRFMNLFGSPNTVAQDKICYGPGALGETLTYGFGPSFFSQPIPGVTRCMIVWGLRPGASMPLLWRRILKARRAGAKLIVIDPERIRQEVHQADLWLQNRPGTDAALALGFLHTILGESRHDEAFVAEHTVGIDELREHVARYTPEYVEELTTVPADRIRAAARLLADHSPAIIHAGNGLCQNGRGSVQTGRALACLVAVTGNLGVEGGHQLSGPPRDLVANGEALGSLDLPASQRRKRLGAASFPLLGEGFEQLDEVLQPAWHGRRHIMNWLDSAHEPTLWQAITTQRPYPVTALLLQHHNPVGASPNAARIAEALVDPKLELLVSQDLFLNASSHLADYVLPAAHWLEKPFISFGLGLTGFAGDYVECKPAVLEAEAEHHNDYELWRDLGRRLEQSQHWPDTLEEFWDACLRPAQLDFATVSASLGPLFGPAASAGHSGDSGDPARKPRYGTPSGRIELRSSLLERWGRNPLPDYEPAPIIAENRSQYPLLLITGGRKIEGFHQDAQQMPWFRRKHPDPLASLHPELALSLDVADGDWIWIETPGGRIRQRARLSEDLHRDVVHADRWWYPERADDEDDPFGWRTSNINVCTEGSVENCDAVFGTWLLRGLPCRVAKAD